MKFLSRILVLVIGLLMVGLGVYAQSTILWSSSGGSAWLTTTNWTGSVLPGASDIAQFGVNPTATTGVGINGNTNGNISIGAVEVTSARSNGFLIGNSTSTAGKNVNFTLNGATINSNANTIIRTSATGGTFTIANVQNTGTQSTTLFLGNATANNIYIDGAGNLAISTVIASSTGTTPLRVLGAGTGTATFSGTNTFTGLISCLGSEAVFNSDAALGNSANNIIVDGGRLTFGATYTLASARNISLGAATNTSVSVSSGFTGTYNGVMSDKTSTVGVLTKQGAGTLVLGGVNTYSGATTINNGTIQLATGSNRLPTGTLLTIGSSGKTCALDLNGFNQTVAGLNSVTSTSNTVTSTAAATLTIGGSGTYTYTSGIISGAISLVMNGSGNQTLAGANTFTGTVSLNNGTLSIGAANTLPTTSNITFNGGTLATGATSGYSQTLGVLTLSNNSTISLGTGVHSLTFSASNLATWTSGKVLTINGWTGTSGSSGSAGKVYFGSSSSGLTAAQLANITFTGYGQGAKILSTGEIVPNGPVISTTGTLATALNTTYGTASAVDSFYVSGTNMQAGVLVTPPSGFYVSSARTNGFASSITVGASGTIASTKVYVSIPATTLAGTYSGNIVLTSTSATTVNVATTSSVVSAKSVTVSGATAQNKVWDGTNAATITGASVVGAVNGDVLTLSGGGTFSQTTVGTNITVTASLVLGGTNASSYSLTQPTGLTADITAPSCAAPSSPIGSATGLTTASISWTAASSAPASGYDYEIRTSGVGGSGATGLIVSGNTASTSASITGLTQGTSYTLYVSSNCTASNSLWIASSSFTTPVPPPTVVLSDNSQVSSGSVYQGTTNVILSSFQAAVTTYQAVLNSLACTSAGTYVTADIANFKLWYASSNSFAAASNIASAASASSGSTITFSSLSTTIANGATGYFWITTDINSNATPSNTISIAANPSFTFSVSPTQSGSITAGGAQTILQVVPAITISNNAVSAASITQNTTNSLIYSNAIAVTTLNASLTAFNFTTSGTYSAADVTNFKVWTASSSSFNAGTATLLGTITTSLGAGSHSLTGLSSSFNIGTNYIFVTVDIPCSATIANTIIVNASSASDYTFALGTPTGNGSVGGTQTIAASTATPANVTNLKIRATGTSGQLVSNWTAPTGCYSEIMVVASATAVNTGGTPTGNGSAYTANSTYGSGSAFGNGFVVYKGPASAVNVNGLTNGTSYYVKVFTRYNSTWSAGIETAAYKPFKSITCTDVIMPMYMQGLNGTNSNRLPVAYRLNLSGLTPSATYRYINQIVIASDSNNTSGAGNVLFVGANQSANFVQTSAPGLSTTYGSFTADATGAYTGWFITEPTGNATRFVPGTQVWARIALNDGNGGTATDAYATSQNSMIVLNLVNAAGATNATGIWGASSSNAKDFVCLYDNTTGSGRPFATAVVENDGSTTVSSYSSFYSTNVNSVNGAWGTILPNTLPNGLRRIETRAFVDGSLKCYATSNTGVWPTGSVNTVNVSGGTTAVAISATDAPLNCSNLVLDHSNLTQTQSQVMNVSSNDNVLGNVTITASNYASSLTGLSFTIGGTFVAGDVTNFKLYTSSSPLFSVGTSTLVKTLVASAIANNGTVNFTGFTQSIPVGSSYWYIAADFSASGNTHTLIVPALSSSAFTFGTNASVTSNSLAQGGTITLGVPIPTMSVSSNTINAANVNDGTLNAVLYRVDLSTGVASANLNAIQFTTTGNYGASDISNLKLWYSANSSFATASATLVGTLSSSLTAGGHSFSSLNQVIALGSSYLYLTADITCTNTPGNTIAVNAITASDITIALGTPSGTGTATATQTITSSTPTNMTSFVANATGVSGQVILSGTLPTSCYDEVLVIAAPATVTGTPSGNGSAYTANATYANGTSLGNGYVVYKGSTLPQVLNGFTNATTYTFKVYTRHNSTWSTGLSDTAMVVALPAINEVIFPQYAINGTNSGARLHYACRLQVINLTPNATYRYATGASNSASISGSTTAPGNLVVINNTANTYGNIVGYTSSKGMNGTLLTSDVFASTSGYGEFTTDALGSYTGWFGMVPTGNAAFAAGNNVYFYLGINNGANGTSQVAQLRSSSTITMLTETSATNGARAVKGVSSATSENMIFLYDNIAGTGRPIYGTWAENDGINETYSTWYSTTGSVNGVNGSWGAYVPSNLANGIRRIEQRNVVNGSIEGCPILNINGNWPQAGNTVNPTFGTATPISFNNTDGDFALPTIGLGVIPTQNVNAGNVSVNITGSTGAPNAYRVDWDASANSTGFVDKSYAAIAGSSILLNVAPSVIGTYSGFVYVKDSLRGCESNPISFSVTITGPTATVSGADTIFVGDSTSISIAFTGVGPWNITLSDGSTYSVNTSPALVKVIPTTTQTYTVSSLTDNGSSYTTTNNSALTGGAFIVVVALNDTCTAAQSLTVTPNCMYTAGSSLNGHPSASSASCGNSDDDVWFSFIKPAGMTMVTVNVQGGSNYNPAFEILNSCGGSVINCTNNSNSTSNSTETSNVSFPTAQGTYLIRVFDARVGAGSGNFSVCLVGIIPAPQNDDPCGSSNFSGNTAKWGGASTILASYDGGSPIFMGQANNAQSNPPTGVNLVYFSGSNAYANNLGANEPTPPCGNLGANAHTVWFKFKAPTIGGIDVKLRTLFNGNPTNFATNIAAYALSVDPCTNTPSFTNLGCATTGTLNLSAISTVLAPYAGQYIYVQLAGNGASSPVGNYMLSIQAVPQNIALSNPTTSSLTVTLPTAPGATNVSVQWRAVGTTGYSLTNISPSLGTYTINGLSSGVNYQVWAKYYNNNQAFYTNFATMGTVVGCSAVPATPSIIPVANHCSRDTIEWPAHPLASGAFPYRLYWKQTASTGGYSVLAVPAAAYNNATGKVDVLLTNLAVNTSYQFYYRVLCAGGAQVASNVATYTQCNGPAKMDGTFHGNFEHNGRYFVDADFVDVTNFTDNTPADGNVHEVVLNEVNDMNAVLNGSGLKVANNGEENGAFELIPNPTSDNVFVEYNVANAGRVVVRVMNIQGKMVKEEVMENSDAIGAVQIDLSDLQSGVYMVSVDAPGYKATKRLVVTK
ncbi:MAG: YDG domain-containing protein [Chitinophagales bacterium]|nr:YDG domain-containing protein [Chitinophagales bacterium]